MTQRNGVAPIFYGALASAIMLGVYFAVLSLVSGLGFAQNQFASFWYFIVSLSLGFGIQIGLYFYLKELIHDGQRGGRVLGLTATTSTAAMISCCTHYLANLLPILGVLGVVTFAAQYQIELFWVGLLFNLGGIAYMAHRIFSFRRLLL